MSTETTNKKIKIDNGTTFGRTYTDKAIDAKLPTDLIASANKLSLGVGNTALGNGVNLDGFTYDEATKTLKASGGESIPVVEGTISATTTDGAFSTYTIPKAQTSCFIFKCDLGTAFVSYNGAYETYSGYLDANGDVIGGNFKLTDLIIITGSGTTINIFFANINGESTGEFDIITSDNLSTYIGNISGKKPVILISGQYAYVSNTYNSSTQSAEFLSTDTSSNTHMYIRARNGSITYKLVNIKEQYYSHFITISKGNDIIYLQYYDKSQNSFEFDMNRFKTAFLNKKAICTGILGDSDETKADPKFVYGENGGLEVYYALKNGVSGAILSKSIVDYNIKDTTSPVE